jgi:hypothetical protein
VTLRFNLHSAAKATDQLRPARGRGMSLDARNEAKGREPGVGLDYLHPTKGWRRVSPRRVRAIQRLSGLLVNKEKAI